MLKRPTYGKLIFNHTSPFRVIKIEMKRVGISLNEVVYLKKRR